MARPLSPDLSPSWGMPQFEKRNIMGTGFETTERYKHLRPVGMGVSGLVCSAKDNISNRTCAVKKLADPFKNTVIAQHMFREIKLLRQLRHDNIIHLVDIFISPSEDIYLVTDLMSVDLHSLLRTRKMDNQFTQYFLYQMMRGLKYVHSAGVVHRDLKPSNILINENCDLKICDFGLARIQDPQMTGYVSTRYYRAPEIMLTWRRYNEKVDMWSVGCIFAEMLLGNPIFQGKNHIDQFCVITQILGSPPASVVANVTSQNTLQFLHSLPDQPRKPLSSVIPDANSNAIALLEKMLQFDPERRIPAHEALESRYLAPYHDPDDEPSAAEMFDDSFSEANLSVDAWKSIIYSEVMSFHDRSEKLPQYTVPRDWIDAG